MAAAPLRESILQQEAPRFGLANIPKNAVGACCPVIARFLNSLGYEEAMTLKGYTQIALWLNAFISLLFMAIWFGDVFTLQCYQAWPGDTGATVTPCLLEAVGLIIFFISFRDSLQMIAHFDNDRQEVLARKTQVLRRLDVESNSALARAQGIVSDLRAQVMATMARELEESMQDVLAAILPSLHEAVEGSAEVAIAQQLVAELRRVATEVATLARGMLSQLVQGHAEVYEKVHKESKGWMQQDLAIWDVWLRTKCPKMAVATGEAVEDLPGDERVAKLLAEAILKPFNDLLAVPGHFANYADQQKQALRERENRGRRVGFGRPPWEADGDRASRRFCICCIPRIVSGTCGWLFCCCCGRAWCRQKSPYEPKRLRIGCFWVQIYTKLQERLVQSLIFSTLYLGIYLYFIYSVLDHFSLYCRGDQVPIDAARKCVLGLTRKGAGVVSLLCYVPSIVVCLRRIHQLDAVMDTIVTSWALEDIHKAVTVFNQSMGIESGHIQGLKAIQDRLQPRFDLVAKLGIRVREHLPEKDRRQLLVLALRQAVDFFRLVAQDLGPAERWFAWDDEEKSRRAACARRHADVLRWNEVREANGGSGSSISAVSGQTFIADPESG